LLAFSLFSQFSHNQQPICTIVGEMTDADEIMHPQCGNGYSTDIRIQINPKIRIRIPDLLFQILALAEVCTLYYRQNIFN